MRCIEVYTGRCAPCAGTERGITSYTMKRTLDELKLSISLAVARSFSPSRIRGQILANLHRWKGQGVWATAYDAWQDIALSGDDGRLLAAMLGRDEEAIRLRQSMPYVGLLSRSEVRRLYQRASSAILPST